MNAAVCTAIRRYFCLGELFPLLRVVSPTPPLLPSQRLSSIHQGESSREFVTAIRKYLRFYLRACERTGQLGTLEAAAAAVKADKKVRGARKGEGGGEGRDWGGVAASCVNSIMHRSADRATGWTDGHIMFTPLPSCAAPVHASRCDDCLVAAHVGAGKVPFSMRLSCAT